MAQNDGSDSFVGRFQLLLEMSRGGMATLYLGRLSGPERFQKLLVIKKVHERFGRERQFVEMLMDEARIAALIQHPNVGTIFELGMAGPVPFIAMEYIHGHTLAELMVATRKELGSMAWAHGVRVASDAAAGLHAAHELTTPEGALMNVVHRDVSPQNILVSYDGHVKVVDFGIAFAHGKLVQTTMGTLKGKMAYMSPEQAAGHPLDRRSDVFSLGIVLWECLTLKRLFKEKSEAATIDRVLQARVSPPTVERPDLPVELSNIVMKALAKDRDQRFASALEMQEALEDFMARQGAVVGQLQLARLMARLFPDQKKLKDGQIQSALAKPPGERPRRATGMTTELSPVSSDSPDTLTWRPTEFTDTVVDRTTAEQTVKTPGPAQRPPQSGIPTVALDKEAPFPPEPTTRLPEKPSRRLPVWAWIGAGTAAGLLILFAVWMVASRFTGSEEPSKRGQRKTQTHGPGTATKPAVVLPATDPNAARPPPAESIPAPRPWDVSSLRGRCRKLYDCGRDLIVHTRGEESRHAAVISIAAGRDPAKRGKDRRACRRILKKTRKKVRQAPDKWPVSCGGKLEVKDRANVGLPRSDLELCSRVYRCCVIMNWYRRESKPCETLKESIVRMGPGFCLFMWYRQEELMRLWAKFGKARPGVCPAPK